MIKRSMIDQKTNAGIIGYIFLLLLDTLKDMCETVIMKLFMKMNIRNLQGSERGGQLI